MICSLVPDQMCGSEWVGVRPTVVDAADVAGRPLSVSNFVKVFAFSQYASLASACLQSGGLVVSHVCNSSFYMSDGLGSGLLVLEKALPRYRRIGRPISVSAVPLRLGIDIWRSCRFLGSLLQALRFLPGGLERFLPCRVGDNHAVFGIWGWRRVDMGSRPGLGEPLQLIFLMSSYCFFRYLPNSGVALLSGVLPLMYCSAGFAPKTPS